MLGGAAPSLSPSFNNYSSGNLAEIAARVVSELGQELDPDGGIFSWAAEDPPLHSRENSGFEPHQAEGEGKGEDEDEDEDEDEFEFAVVCREPESFAISADEIFYNGQIRPLYPIFDQTLLLDEPHADTDISKASKTSSLPSLRRLPLRKLMVEDREREQQGAREAMSCSSSEADELERLAPGTYCAWTPAKSSSPTQGSRTPGRCKKSHSTGSSKRWKFRDLLYRSNSDGDGDDKFVFLASFKKAEKTVPVASKEAPAKEEDHKKRPYLPNRKDLVGFFANVNGLSRSLQPF